MLKNAILLLLFLPALANAQPYSEDLQDWQERYKCKETFPGGRYLDVDIDSIRDNRVVIDFNKACNPHTAYEKGYPYIIPPARNSLQIDINAGEKIFGKNPGY